VHVHGTYAKTANQRLVIADGAGYSPNAKTLRFGIRNHPKHTTHELQRTAGTTTSPSVTPWEFAGVVWEVACCSEKPGWAHDTAKTKAAAGTTLGWDAARGHFNGTWPPRVARSSPPFVTQRNLLNQATRKSKYVPKRKAYLLLLPFCAFDGGFKGPSNLSSGMWSKTNVMT
jgi:hypothetical protein